jgi:hypothetical protein
MAFPFIFESNFEQGTNAEWDSGTDTASQLDFPHFTELARSTDKDHVPLNGAYVARWTLSGGTADAILVEGDIDISAAATAYFRMAINFSEDFAATADDTVNLFELKATATVEAALGFRVVAATGVINLGVGELTATSFSSIALTRGEWYIVELRVLIDDGASDNGSIGLFISQLGDSANPTEDVTVSSLDQGAITSGELGTTVHLATTTGEILIDHFVMDDAQLFRPARYEQSVEITKDRHVFVGRGDSISAALLDTGDADETLKLYDTNTAQDIPQNLVLELGAQTASDDVLHFSKGCYAVLRGTTPRAAVTLPRGVNGDGVVSPTFYNSLLVKKLGRG